jgi:hypothetical protein
MDVLFLEAKELEPRKGATNISQYMDMSAVSLLTLGASDAIWVFGDLQKFRQETNIDMLVGYISCTPLSFTAFNSNCLVSRKKTRQSNEPQSQPRSNQDIS